MKKVILSLFVFCLPLLVFGQTTIHFEDFPRQAEFIDTFFSTNPDLPVPIPEEGENLVWDYSQVTPYQTSEQIHLDATNNTDFPEALNSFSRRRAFQGLNINLKVYEAIDQEGFYEVGRTQLESAYSLTSITGGSNDSLIFIEENIHYEGRVNALKFPLNYGDQWTESHVEYFPFQLTVEAFGFNQMPGTQKRVHQEEREVVGWGDLIIPDLNGNPSVPIPVLLLKIKEFEIDSTFLAGQPATPAFLSAFGLQQGLTTTYEYYLFYMSGYDRPVADIVIGSRLIYRPSAAEFVTSAQETFRLKGKSFPNPIEAGGTLSFQLEAPLDSGVFRLTDTAGRLVFEQRIEALGQSHFGIKLPESLERGFYFYQIQGNDQSQMRAEKLWVH